jgi:hypothetical protein
MTTCTCPNPPGGSMTCPDGYSAICRVENGQSHGECVPPDPDDTEISMRLRVLEAVTRIPRPRRPDGTWVQALTDEDRRILETGLYMSPDGRTLVTFTLARTNSSSGTNFLTR